MKRRIGIVLAVAALGLSPVLASQDDLAAKVAGHARLAADKAPTMFWKFDAKLRELGPDVVEALKPYLKPGNPTFRIAAAATLIHFGEKQQGQKILLAMAGNEDLKIEVRRVAVGVLGRRGASAVAKDLNALLEDTLNPVLKLEIAKALWKVSLNHRPEAKRVFRDYLNSEDPDLQAAGALALAECDDIEVAQKVLEKLKDEPTRRGQLARSYLRILDVFRQLDNAFYRNPHYAVQGDKFDLIDEVLHNIKLYHLVGDTRSEKELMEAAARSILRVMDPGSTYLTAEQRADLMKGPSGHLADFGAFINFDVRGVLTVFRPVFGTPAFEAGLRVNDKILEVDGWSTFDRDVEQVLKRLGGAKGSSVKIKVVRRGWKEPRTLTLERRRPEVAPLLWEMLPGGIGLVQLLGFGNGTGRSLDVALERMKASGMKGLVLDLRNGQGGNLSAAVEVVDRFLDEGKLVVYWEGRSKFVAPREEVRTRKVLAGPVYPIVVLVNRHTAGASEIVAGVLQFYKRARVVGQRSYGRASVQKIIDLTSRQGDRFEDTPKPNGKHDPGEPFTDRNKNGTYDKGEPFEDKPRLNGRWDPGEPYEDLNKNGRYDVGPGIRITIARYYLPDGRCIQDLVNGEGKVTKKGGIEPDIEIGAAGWPGWKEEELSKCLEKNSFREYVDRQWEKEKGLFRKLAVFDGYDAGRYPGFEDFMKGLDTRLTREDVRRWLRIYVRRKVMETRGKALVGLYVEGDFQEDRQMQRGILEVLKALVPPLDPGTIEEYAALPDKVKEENGK